MLPKRMVKKILIREDGFTIKYLELNRKMKFEKNEKNLIEIDY